MCGTIDSIYAEDIQNIVSDGTLPWDRLEGSTILVTGATGLIGRMTVLSLLEAERHGREINVIALVRSREKAERLFGEYIASPRLSVVVGDVLALPQLDAQVDYIIHAASVTGSRDFVERPVDTISTALGGTMNMLELAHSKNIKGFLYLSSLEVYGVTPEDMESVTENDYGRIDPLSVRSSYSEGKRMAENLCVSYGVQYGVPVRVARLAQTFGAGVDYRDNRVFAMFARSVIEGEDIVLRTDGSTLRNYCYLSDAVRALLTILVRGEDGAAYNVANRSTAISIKDMAELYCKLYPESETRVVFDIAENITALGYNPKVVLRLNTERLEKLGWQPQVDMPQMVVRLVSSMKQRRSV